MGIYIIRNKDDVVIRWYVDNVPFKDQSSKVNRTLKGTES